MAEICALCVLPLTYCEDKQHEVQIILSLVYCGILTVHHISYLQCSSQLAVRYLAVALVKLQDESILISSLKRCGLIRRLFIAKRHIKVSCRNNSTQK